MGILSTNKKIINLGQGYSAGSGISIDDYVISYTGNEGQLYNAGPNIDIYDDQDQLYISGKDWSADISNASSNAYEQATALIPPEFDPSYISGVVDSKLDSTAFSTVSGDYATTSYVDMSDDLTYSRATAWGNQNLAPLNSVADNSAKWNGIEVYEQNSATYLTAHQDISNKLDTTAFSTVSGTFLTAHQVIPSAKWEDASDVVQSNSAQWSENTGDEEVNNAVYNNSANWNDITVYQTNSANYLTAHQDISNKLDTTAFSTVSGTFLTAHQDLSNYATTGDLNTTSGILSGAIDYLSGNAGKTYTGISPIVVNNDTNEISADITPVDITFGEGLDFTNGTLSVTGTGPTYTGDAQGALDEVYENSGVWLTAHQDISNKLDTTAFSTVSGNFLTAVDLTPYYTTADANTLSSMLSGAIDYVSANAGDEFPASANEAITAYQNASGTYLTAHQVIPSAKWENASIEVQSNSSNWNDITVYQTNSASYLTAHQDISYKLDTTSFSTVSGTFLTAHQPISANEWNSVYDTVGTNSSYWAGGGTTYTGDAQGALDEVYTNSADWNSNYSTVYSNSSTWTNGGFTGEVYGISGVSPNVDVYIDQDTLWISAGGFEAGDTEVNNYVQTNSATIDETIDYTQTNSANIEEISAYVQSNSANYVSLSAQYNELKQSYDALSSLFATYSGQWLLPNQGE